MSSVVVRYRPKADRADENLESVEAVWQRSEAAFGG